VIGLVYQLNESIHCKFLSCGSLAQNSLRLLLHITTTTTQCSSYLAVISLIYQLTQPVHGKFFLVDLQCQDSLRLLLLLLLLQLLLHITTTQCSSYLAVIGLVYQLTQPVHGKFFLVDLQRQDSLGGFQFHHLLADVHTMIKHRL